mgnify:FL=1
MKKAIIAASAAIIMAAGAATCWTVFGGNEDEFFNENLEALLSGESRPSFLEPEWTVAVVYHGATGAVDVSCHEGGNYECPMYDPDLPKT